MTVNQKNDDTNRKLKFPFSDLILFCFGNVSKDKKSDISKEMMFDDNLLQVIRKIRRLQREFGDDYNLIINKLGQVIAIGAVVIMDMLE